MIQYFVPSNWFWILIGFLLCCYLSVTPKEKNFTFVQGLQQASSEVIRAFR